jgi:membrane protease YdiL (CAAX protease family)
MEQFFMGLIVFIIVAVVQRKDVLTLRWQPTRDTWAAMGVGALAFALSASMLLVGTESLAGKLIHRLGIYVLCGVALPWGYVLLVEHGKLADLGLMREKWGMSLAINVILAALMSLIIIFEADLNAMHWGDFAKAAVALVGAGGLFEAFLYYGFIHQRLDKAFGMAPAIFLTALIYVTWHTGTQLPLEADPLGALWKLFWVGVMYQSVFSLTHNLWIIWPFFHGVGVMIDFAINIGATNRVAAEFPRALGTLLGMAGVGLLLIQIARQRPMQSPQSRGEREVTGRI